MNQANIGRRVISEHGLISNVLVALGLVDIVRIANIFRRTHRVTVPWNSGTLVIPRDSPSKFPKIVIPSDEFVCRRIEANIDGETGVFYGWIKKSTNQPEGYGVFVAGDWVHCC